MQKKYFNSIFITNFYIILVLLFINLLFLIFERLNNYNYYFLFFNIILFSLYVITNIFYKNEYNLERGNLKEILYTSFSNSEIMKEVFFKKMKYKENDEIFNLFKGLFVRKNIINKDYLELKNIFFKMVPKNFINEVGEAGIDRISLGISIKKFLTVMFLDIIGFTSIAERLPQDRALLLLNIYFDGIVEIIKNNGGYVDKFLGDGMMIVFDEMNSDNSIKASIEIQNFISKFQISEIGKKIAIGIGINSGEVIMGTIGSKDRMEITLIGDVVNSASRLEGFTRIYDNKIIISENTFNLIKNKDDFKINNLGLKEIKGRENKIKIYGIEPFLNIKI